MKPWLVTMALGLAFMPLSADAGTLLTTPPLITDSSLEAVCLAQNVASALLDLDVTLMNDAGSPVATNSCHQTSGSCRISVAAPNGVLYCVVEVGPLKQQALVTLMLVDQDGVVRNSIEAHFED